MDALKLPIFLPTIFLDNEKKVRLFASKELQPNYYKV
jgi:hypothetical protein